MARVCVLAALFIAVPALAHAAVYCGPRDEVAAKLKSAFGETRTAMGTKGPKAIMEMWTSEKTGSWSVVMNYTDGRSCIVAVGNDYTVLDEPLEDPV